MSDQGLDYRSRFLVSKLGIQDPSALRAITNILDGALKLEEEFEAERRKLARERAEVRHRVKAFRETAFTVSNETDTAVPLTVELFDTDAYHDTSTNPSRITIPEGLQGTYEVQFNTIFAPDKAGAIRRASIFKNGADLLFKEFNNPTLETTATEATTISGSFDVDLKSGDYLELFVYQDSGGNLSLAELLTESLNPDAILDSTNLTGAVTDIDDDPLNPDANWLEASDTDLSTDVRVSFPTPSFTPTGTVDVTVQVRKTSALAIAPTLDIELFENGSLVQTLESNLAIGSANSEVHETTFDAGDISVWSDVEIKLSGSGKSGVTVEYGALQLDVKDFEDGSDFPTSLSLSRKSERRASP